MALQLKAFPSRHFVTVSADGEVTRADIEAYLSEIERLNAIGWKKLVDLRNARIALTEEDILQIGVRLRQADATSAVGALAVVMPQSEPEPEPEPERVMRLLGFLAAAKRPMRIFKAIGPARRWIKSIRFEGKRTAGNKTT